MAGITYKQSGVDIHKANTFVDWIVRKAKTTRGSGVVSSKVSFGSLFDIGRGYREPILVSSTDGVGTKLMIANLVNKHDTVGIDLVAMNVNDILCAGAKPLFFLDYLACGQLRPAVLKKVMQGIIEGCRQAGCSLIGGETAEMPGIYKKEDYDLAGFAVGVVEKKKIISGARIKTGNVIVGLASNGLHSNGFSLVRKVLSLQEQKHLSHELLKPTRIYVKPALRALERFDIKGMAHVTGGAFFEKMSKILPAGKCFAIERGSWPVPKIFQIIQTKGRIADQEMFTTLNMGIGLAVVVDKKDAERVIAFFQKEGIPSWAIGKVIDHKEKRVLL
ncbi:MAG TPA: phosphoribosylformylglycinamidine cyclo-ligase [Candidatus Omnitrophota bacterium]|nr:phosphoribosylformylglycinamidine cyclo-ligase [Candidatus Omnitrophota bacterium]HQL41006.1 phosphoribosylformylglycinamidine cyclo-ligase [Candidatus Omnitrophota bacterium]